MRSDTCWTAGGSHQRGFEADRITIFCHVNKIVEFTYILSCRKFCF